MRSFKKQQIYFNRANLCLLFILFFNCAEMLTEMHVDREKLYKPIIDEEIEQLTINDSKSFDIEFPYSGQYEVWIDKSVEGKISIRMQTIDTEDRAKVYSDTIYAITSTSNNVGFISTVKSNAGNGMPYVPMKKNVTIKLELKEVQDVETTKTNLRIYIKRIGSFLR